MGAWLDQITIAYRAGADQELEACCAEVFWQEGSASAAKLRDRRRPKPSLKERIAAAITDGDYRTALSLLDEALPND